MTTLDKDFYDEEQTFRDEMTRAERNIRKKNPDANDENIDILLNEYREQQQVESEIEAEVYDMRAQEEEHDDYQEDY